MQPLCDQCQSVCSFDPLSYVFGFQCPDCGFRPMEDIDAYNSAERQIWLRSPTLVYSTTMKQGHLMKDGTIRGRPGLRWERWPGFDF